jgi:hypothetical protein
VECAITHLCGDERLVRAGFIDPVIRLLPLRLEIGFTKLEFNKIQAVGIERCLEARDRLSRAVAGM